MRYLTGFFEAGSEFLTRVGQSLTRPEGLLKEPDHENLPDR
jgi:hypothetical protein